MLEHQRSVVQLRLHLALLLPGYDLPSEPESVFDPCLELRVLDDEAINALSAWLLVPEERRTGGKARPRGDANVIGAATKPSFVESVERVRQLADVSSGYRTWRRKWFDLDRYFDEEGRRNRVKAVLGDRD